MRMKKGSVEDLDTAIDLRKMAHIIDKIGALMEAANLSSDEAVWAAALAYLSTFNATDSFANTESLNAAARALLREASDVFDSLPDLAEEPVSAAGPGVDGGDDEDDDAQGGDDDDDDGRLDEDVDDDVVDAGGTSAGRFQASYTPTARLHDAGD